MFDNRGWVCVHRKLLEWEWYSDINVSRLFLHLLLKANFEDKKWQGKVIKRGELITSRSKLSLETGLSERQVRTALTKLKLTNEIAVKATSEYTHISLCNYLIYQDKSETSDQPKDEPKDQQSTSNRPTIDQQSTTTKQYNNITIKQDNKDSDSPHSPPRGKDAKTASQKSKKTNPKQQQQDDFKPPDGIDPDVWGDYEAMRKLIKKPLTPKAKELVVKKLIDLNKQTNQCPNDILNQSIMNSWQGVFPLKENTKPNNQKDNYYGNNRNQTKNDTTTEAIDILADLYFDSD